MIRDLGVLVLIPGIVLCAALACGWVGFHLIEWWRK